MPRPNATRSIAAEHALARRIAFERGQRGMSYEGLAARMSRAGCPIHASALFKIEREKPPRRITVDELVGLSRVFGMPMSDLIVDPTIDASHELRRLFTATIDAHDAAAKAVDALEDAAAELRAYADAQPETVERVESYLASDQSALTAFHSYLTEPEG